MNQPAYWILRCEHRLLALPGKASADIFPLLPAGAFGHPENALYVGELNGQPCHALDVEAFPEFPGSEPTPLRAVFSLAGAETFAVAGRATQLLDWRRNHRFCGHCGTPTVLKQGELAMQCPNCRLLAYPRISPAVMVLVRDGNKLLLGRSPHFKPGVFSALAGFVEAGETLEACAAREVREEVGVEISNLRYFDSQPWPFPNSLMVAFFADYASGTITPDPKEIEAADWFAPEALPLLPEPISISRRLIEAALRDMASAKPEQVEQA